MKRRSNYLFALLLIGIIGSGCSKQQPAVTNGSSPTNVHGNFTGEFTLIHLNPLSNKLDTSYATITLSLLLNATYSVGGDTTKIQAPSNGTFSNDATTITFTDATVTKKTPANTPKKHLNGPFLYTYDGTNLRIYGASDTLNYNYVLTTY